ncbi:hypothetical protein [Devosia elaeis]|uniref:Uncharacterized protein n=1 Tax=Devosia elaeis TaxID=1770058 RepID=A0A178HP19_9HYPH|nr:hypothetical protein [Devosia elaeis]OAM73754.1 hypothetical protein A3840_17320 [Devosia elaeis]
MSERVEDLSRRLAEVTDGELDAFLAWLAQHWTVAPHEVTAAEMTPEQIEGWNRCVDSIPAAIALWLEDETRL